MKRDMVYIRIATALSVLLITFSMFRLWENSIALKEGIRVTTDALHMEMKQKLNSILTYKGTTCVHVEGDTANLENTYLDMKVTAYDTQTKQDVSDTLDTKIYDTGMQLKGAHPIVIIMQGDADRLNDREIMIQLTAQLEQANFYCVPYDNRETNHNFSGEIYIQFPSFGVQWLLVMIEGGTYDGNRETETIKNIDE